MTTTETGRPPRSEFSDYHAAYADLVPEGDVVGILSRQIQETAAFLGSLTEEQGNHRYQPGKWSIKEVVGHLIDTEWVFTYRALCFARGDRTPLPTMEQDDYVANADFDSRKLSDLCAEFVALRGAGTALFRGLTPQEMLRKGRTSDHEFTVRTVPYVIAGHELHHVRVLRERYL